MENKFTKGKWHSSDVKIQKDFGDQVYFSIDTDHAEIRNKTYVIPGFFYPHSAQTKEEMIANAKLIAGAPRLLEALNSILTDIESEHADNSGYYNVSIHRNQVYEAKEAIKKATEWQTQSI